MISGKITGKVDVPMLDAKAFIKECNKLLEEAAKSMNSDFRAATGTWKHKPIFSFWGPYRRGNALFILAGPTSYEGRDQIFEYVDQGTKPHVIRPRARTTVRGRAKTWPALRFKSKYTAKTQAYSMYSRSGGKSGRYRYRFKVNHPGSKGRQFIALSAANHQRWWNTKVAMLMAKFGEIGLARRIQKVYR